MSEVGTAPERAAELADRPAHRWDLDVLRIAAILGVVAIHVFGLILAREDLRGTQTWHFGVVLDYATRWCVPMFVMISGALLLSPRAHAGGPAPFLRKRVVRLVPALVFWHLVYLVLVRKYLMGQDLEASVVALNLIDAKVYTALYFLWLILGLYVVAPVLAAFLAGGGQRRATVTAVAALAWTVAVSALPSVTTMLGGPRPRPEGALTMWLPYVGLFLAGYAWRQARATGLRWLWTGLVATLLLVEVVWQYESAPDPRWLQALLPLGYTGLPIVLASICLFVCGIDLMARLSPPPGAVRVVRSLSEATFGVFLCHLVVVALMRRWWPDWYADPSPVAKTQMYVAVLAAAFAISLLARRIPVLRRVF